jgi:hypothetical protein
MKAICISNEAYQVSLVLGKKYEVTSDPCVNEDTLIRVIDESGEDYWYPVRMFQIAAEGN